MFNIFNIMKAVDNYAETYANTSNVFTVEEMRNKVLDELGKVYKELDRHEKQNKKLVETICQL